MDRQEASYSHISTQALIRQSSERMLSKMEALSFMLGRLPTLLTTSPTTADPSIRYVHVIGQNQNNILTPLLLLQSQTRAAFSHMLSPIPGRIPFRCPHWLPFEFDHLVDSATQEAAALSPGSSATSFDRWSYRDGGQSISELSRTALSIILKSQPKRKDAAELDDQDVRETKPSKHLCSSYDAHSFSSAIGHTQITVPCSPDFDMLDEARMAFVPSAGICPTSLAVHFIRSRTQAWSPEYPYKLTHSVP